MAFATQILFGLVKSEAVPWRKRKGTVNFHTMSAVLLDNMQFLCFPNIRDFLNPMLSD